MPTQQRRKMAVEQALSDPDMVMNEQLQRRIAELVENQFMSRGAFLTKWMDPRRDYNKECGYPETYELTSDKFQDYYERHPVAARVVELLPSECWQLTPDILEDEDPNNATPFEQAFEDVGKSLRGQNSFFKPDEKEAHPLWEACRRADIASRIGQYGLILLGFDDGLSLNQPVEGWQEPNAGSITWNEGALPFLEQELQGMVSINEFGELVYNAFPPKKDEDQEDPKKIPAEGNGKKPKKKTDVELLREKKASRLKQAPSVKQSQAVASPEQKGVAPDTDPKLQSSKGFLPEPTEGDSKTIKSMPSQAAFGNINPQQGKYRDPMDTSGQNDVKPMDPQQPDYGEMTGDKSNSDIQPFKEDQDLGQDNALIPKEQQAGRSLLYIRIFPESLVQIMQYEQNMASPRFGQPVMYRVTLNDPMQQQSGVGLPLSTVEVHYSRVIHINDVGSNFTSSEIFSAPAMRPVLNNLIDLQKIYGACGEGYWKNAFATLAAETHPQLGGDVTMDTADMRDQMKKWRDSLDRVLAATGVTWKTISPQIIDPNSYVQNELNAICIKLGCPLRVFMGSEQGVLAASQDAMAWAFRVKERRKNYITPRIIVPLIDRLIQVGVLPTPEFYSVKWDEEQKLTPMEQAQVAGAQTGALATYISGQVDQLIEPVSYLTEVLGWDRDKAQSIIDSTMEHILKQQEAQAAQGSQMIDPTTGQPLEQDPETGEYIDPNTGEPLQTDEFGKPVMIGPDGQPIPVQQQSAQEAQGPLGAEAQMEAQGGQEQPMGQEPQVDPETGQPIPPQEQPPGEDQVMPQEGEVDEETGLPIDPETGYLVHEQSGYLIDKQTGDVYDPESGEVIDNLFEEGDQQPQQPQEMGDEQVPIGEDQEPVQEVPQEGQPDPTQEIDQSQASQGEAGEVDEETGLPIDPATGRLVNPEGYQLDQETGDIYDPEGNHVGNIDDEEEQSDGTTELDPRTT